MVQETITLDQQLAAISKVDAVFREGFQWSENPLDDLISRLTLPRSAIMENWRKRSRAHSHLLSLFVYVVLVWWRRSLRTFDSSLWSLCTHHLIVTIVTHRPLISFFGGPSVIINHKPQTTNHEPQTSNHQPQTTNHKPQRSKWRSQQLNALLNRIPWACKPILCQFTNYCARAQELSHRQECVHTFCCLDCNNSDGLDSGRFFQQWWWKLTWYLPSANNELLSNNLRI